jgi:uncharacterized protein YdbL (DUF1318 family)
MLRVKSLGFVGLWLMLASCVTINVYFPAAAADEAARTIVRDVLGSEGEPEGADSGPSTNKTSRRALPATTIIVGVLVDFVVAPAHAQPDINIDTPAVAALRTSLKKRAVQLAPFYANGAIGFTNNGLIAVRDPAKVPLKDRTLASKLVADDNQDRAALYQEIARANAHPEWEQDVRATFARVWVDEAPKGYWHQDSSGAWKQK